MPRGTITKNLGRGLYEVKIHGDLTKLKAALTHIENKLAGLEVEIEKWQEKEQELYNKKENMEVKVSDAQTAYDDGDLTISQYTAVLQAAIVIYSEYWACKRHLTALESQYTSLNAKRLRWLSSTSPFLDGYENKRMWCADYKMDLEEGDSVGIVSFINEFASGMVIHPFYTQGDYANFPNGWVEDPTVFGSVWGKNSYYSPKRDGEYQPTIGAGDAQNFVNMAMLPAWQRWMPMFRVGKIKKINLYYEPWYINEEGWNNIIDAYHYYPLTANVELDTAVSSAQRLDINPGQKTTQWITGTRRDKLKRRETVTIYTLPLDYHSPPSDLQHDYSETPGMQFKYGDHVVACFKNYDWNRGRIIGYSMAPQCACYKVKIFRKGFPGYEVSKDGDEVEVTDDSCIPIGRNKWILHYETIFNGEHLRVGGIVKPHLYDTDIIDGEIVEVRAMIAAVHVLGGDPERKEHCWGFVELVNKVGRFRGGGGPEMLNSNHLIVDGQISANFRGMTTSPLEIVWATRYQQIGDFWYHRFLKNGGRYDNEGGYWTISLPYFLEGGFFLFAKDIPYTIKTQYPNKYKTDDLFNQGSIPSFGGVESDLERLVDSRSDSNGMGSRSIFMRNRRDFYSGEQVDTNFGDRILDDMTKIYEIHMPYWDVPMRGELDPRDTPEYFSGMYRRNYTVYSSVPFEAMYWVGPHDGIDQTSEVRKIEVKSKAYTIGEQIGTYTTLMYYGWATFPIYDGGCDTELDDIIYAGYGSATGVYAGNEDLLWKYSCDCGNVSVGVPAFGGIHFPGGGSFLEDPYYYGEKKGYNGKTSGIDIFWEISNISPSTVQSRCVIAWYYYWSLHAGGHVYAPDYGSYASPVLGISRRSPPLDMRPVGVYWPDPTNPVKAAECGWVGKGGYALDSGIPDTLHINTRDLPPALDRPGGYIA